MQDEQAMEAALRWHPEWRAAFEHHQLHDEAERHLLTHAAVEGMLSADARLVSIAEDAERRGFDRHEVRHALGRAFLFCWWYHAQEGTGHDEDLLAQRFHNELQSIRTQH